MKGLAIVHQLQCTTSSKVELFIRFSGKLFTPKENKIQQMRRRENGCAASTCKKIPYLSDDVCIDASKKYKHKHKHKYSITMERKHSNHRNRVRSDCSSMQSLTSWRTSASHSTLKRTHTKTLSHNQKEETASNNSGSGSSSGNGKKNSSTSTRKSINRSTTVTEGSHSPPQIRKYRTTTNKTSPPWQEKKALSGPNDKDRKKYRRLPAASSSVTSNSTNGSSHGSTTSQRIRSKGVGTKSVMRKVTNPSGIRKPPGSKNGNGTSVPKNNVNNSKGAAQKDPRRKTNGVKNATTTTTSTTVARNRSPKKQSNSQRVNTMKNKSDRIRLEKTPIRKNHLSPSMEDNMSTHHSGEEKLNQQGDDATNLELINGANMNEDEEYEYEQQLYVPEHNLHLDLKNCAWENMYHQLKDLSTKGSRIQAEINVSSMDDASVLHTACWKAPAGLALIIIKLLPIQDKNDNIFLKQDKDGNTPIHLLCANMAPFFDSNNSSPILDVSVLNLLIKLEPEALNIQNNEGDTPLHLYVTSPAAAASTISPSPTPIATALDGLKNICDNLSNQESIVTKDNLGATPFHSAIASRADESILMALLEYFPAVVKIGDDKGLLPLHYAAAFLHTPASVVERMIELYQYGLCHKTAAGDTPLHILVRNSADDVVFDEVNDKVGKSKLLNRNAIQLLEIFMGNALPIIQGDKNLNEEYDPFFITNNECLTPLHTCALFNASVQVTQLLVGHPSSVRAALATNSFGATPLHLAAAQPNVSVDIATAVGNANPDAAVIQDKRKMTPLHVAVLNEYATTDLIECIVDVNPEAIDIPDSRGNVPLHLAIQSQSKDHVVETLLRLYPIKKQFKNNLLDTPLHDAARNNNISTRIIRLFVNKYHEALRSQNSHGDVPLHCAASSQSPQPDIIEVLLEALPESAYIQNDKGDCPLHSLVGHTSSISITILRLFKDVAKSSICILNKSNQTPLEKAKENGTSGEIVELLQSWFEEQRVD